MSIGSSLPRKQVLHSCHQSKKQPFSPAEECILQIKASKPTEHYDHYNTVDERKGGLDSSIDDMIEQRNRRVELLE
jgi:hypothetical protein